ncbi:hypothetical protein D3C85_1573380 [compost metagenome]
MCKIFEKYSFRFNIREEIFNGIVNGEEAILKFNLATSRQVEVLKPIDYMLGFLFFHMDVTLICFQDRDQDHFIDMNHDIFMKTLYANTVFSNF